MSSHQDDGKRRIDDPKGCPFIVMPAPALIVWWLLSPRRRTDVAARRYGAVTTKEMRR